MNPYDYKLQYNPRIYGSIWRKIDAQTQEILKEDDLPMSFAFGTTEDREKLPPEIRKNRLYIDEYVKQ